MKRVYANFYLFGFCFLAACVSTPPVSVPAPDPSPVETITPSPEPSEVSIPIASDSPEPEVSPSPIQVDPPVVLSLPTPTQSQGGHPLPATATKAKPVNVSNFRLTQDFKGIALTTELISNPQGSAKLTNVSVTNGNLFWGHGGNKVEIYNSWTEGTSWKYRLCNFDSPLQMLIWDNSGINQHIVQGGRMVKNAQGQMIADGEAAIRLMQVVEAHITGLKVDGWKYDGKHFWKQCIQDRSGGKHYWKNVTATCPVDIGYMTDPNIAIQPLELSHWENCHLDSWPHITPGVKRVEFVNCTIAGQLVNKATNYP